MVEKRPGLGQQRHRKTKRGKILFFRGCANWLRGARKVLLKIAANGKANP